MAVSFTHLSWWLWSGKHQEPKLTKGSTLNSSPDVALWELDTLKFPLVHGGNRASTSRRVKRKWTSRKERKIDREYDVVLVPSDGGCVSGSESDDSDWSIGWLEPHGPGFHDDEESDNSFAVLVPCYGRGHADLEGKPKEKFLGAAPDLYAAGECWFMEHKEFQELPSLRQLLSGYLPVRRSWIWTSEEFVWIQIYSFVLWCIFTKKDHAKKMCAHMMGNICCRSISAPFKMCNDINLNQAKGHG